MKEIKKAIEINVFDQLQFEVGGETGWSYFLVRSYSRVVYDQVDVGVLSQVESQLKKRFKKIAIC